MRIGGERSSTNFPTGYFGSRSDAVTWLNGGK
jgi:hypothetical protein